MKRWQRMALGTVFALVAAAAVLAVIFRPQEHGRGQVAAARVAPAALAARQAIAAEASRAAPVAVATGASALPTQVLFGDLHVHTTFSTDAFAWSLPLMHGEGAHPPADACDFARFCSAIDFFALTDHAESLTARRWQETKQSIRECNAAAGDPRSPDLVAYAGFEWTQVGLTRAEHYGHRNVVFRDDADARLPARAIAAAGRFAAQLRGPRRDLGQLRILAHDPFHTQAYLDWALFQRHSAEPAVCPAGADVHALPPDCQELAATPQELFEKLAQWGFPVLAIPHGTTWGIYTPPGTDFGKQLEPAMLDPERQRLFEIYSGHGNAEQYRSYKAVEFDASGAAVCPGPTPAYEPCCHRAGELIRARCGDAPAGECERRVAEARARYLAAGAYGHHSVPGASVSDWGDCGQCRDCFQPAFSHRPGNSAQAVLAMRAFDADAEPVDQAWGFVASSDNHKARPGTGYKAYARREMTEATGPVDDEARELLHVSPGNERPPLPRAVDPLVTEFANGFARMEFERSSSYFTTGGLVAVHSAGRSREAIWEALRERRVYATSGPRILLWFSLLDAEVDADGHDTFMGSEARRGTAPRFHVHAVGAQKQLPGCPDWASTALGPERLERLCRGECFNPGDARHRITRLEVVRVRPQASAGEPLGGLIDDPWRVLPCPEGAASCSAQFEDPDFSAGARDVTYYVRAIQEPTPEVNGATMPCKLDASGRCLEPKPCYSDYRTPFDDACLADVEERAWSSPIFVRFDRTAAGQPSATEPAP